MKNSKLLFTAALALLSVLPAGAQYNTGRSEVKTGNYWHSLERELRYRPDATDFVIVNGTKRFNRALYATNSAFRVEAGDRPEFGLYMPNMGGNMQLGVIKGRDRSIWLCDMERVEFRYRPGAAIYTITDNTYLADGRIIMTLMVMDNQDGFIVKVVGENLPTDLSLMLSYGGASNNRYNRGGDLGVDPEDCFELKPDYCLGNKYVIGKGEFSLFYGAAPKVVDEAMKGNFAFEKNAKKRAKLLKGVLPPSARMQLVSPSFITTPLDMTRSKDTENKPALAAVVPMQNELYFSVREGLETQEITYNDLPDVFKAADARRIRIASSLTIDTPDPYINTLGGALSMAAEGVWTDPAWLHGAIGWRGPLTGWRAAYTGDVLGWHERARMHFDAYGNSQVTDVEPTIPHPSQDPERSMSRAIKEWGTQMYSNGYISRFPNRKDVMHHYDMNLVYIDQLLWHFNWTGDLDYAKKMWPVLKSHLAWEKRNFDPDNDGLYDAYCCIWASDALEYSGGGVTHSSAYNYRANKMAAMIAEKIGENPAPYKTEAAKILAAINKNLWMPELGHWAEYKDMIGRKQLHPAAALWTIYHSLDSDIFDSFQGYQATRYVDTDIPHIPVLARGLKDEGYTTVSTTNWFPYAWSINNVAHAEVAHTALAYWQAGRNNAAFNLFKSTILDGMYLGSSPGNLGQISFYDAARGECYRDFGDPIGITSRAIVQGLFGVIPDMLNKRVEVTPGFPDKWEYATFSNSDISYDFKRTYYSDTYQIEFKSHPNFALSLNLRAPYEKIEKILVNGRPAKYDIDPNSIDEPVVRITTTPGTNFRVDIIWSGNPLRSIECPAEVEYNKYFEASSDYLTLKAIKDPQKMLVDPAIKGKAIGAVARCAAGNHTFFVQVKQGDMQWWEPVNVKVTRNPGKDASMNVLANVEQKTQLNTANMETIDIDTYFNSSVCDIFKNQYLTPRSPYTTLQIPLHGLGEWCHPEITADIDDSGIRAKSKGGVFTTPFGLPFRIAKEEGKNIIYTSIWDNYPNKVTIPTSVRGKRLYLLMAGSTNPMQSQMDNGVIRVSYRDGAYYLLKLRNPETWCPIEQDYYFDDGAFFCDSPRPYRVLLQTGVVTRTVDKLYGFDGAMNRDIPGGAAIILDIPLVQGKELKEITLETLTNEVVIGLMAITVEK